MLGYLLENHALLVFSVLLYGLLVFLPESVYRCAQYLAEVQGIKLLYTVGRGQKVVRRLVVYQKLAVAVEYKSARRIVYHLAEYVALS